MASYTADQTQLKRELDLQTRADIINQIALKIRKWDTKFKGLEDKIRLNCQVTILVGENKESERKRLFKEITAEICPGLIKEINSQRQEVPKISNCTNTDEETRRMTKG